MLTRISRRAAVDHADTAAFAAHEGWAITYRELDAAADEAAAGLAGLGIRQGSVLALLMGSTVDYVVLYLAAARLGAVTAGVNPRLTGREIQDCLKVLRPDLVICAAGAAGTESLDWPSETVEPGADAASAAGSLRVRGADRPPELPDDPGRAVCVCFTSGSTGTPKGAWFANRQLEAIAELDAGMGWEAPGSALFDAAARSSCGTAEESSLPDGRTTAQRGERPPHEGLHGIAATALAHVGFMTKLPWLMATGRTTHLLRRWSAGPVLELIARHKMRAVTAVAPQIALMLRHPSITSLDFSAVQSIVVGGAMSPGWMVAEARERFGAGYSIRYSSTESGGVGLATAADADDAEALHTIGRPRPGVEAEVRSADGRTQPPGEVGELWLRSPAVMSGYWNDPAGTEAALVDGWLHSGDLARVDESGCFVLAGRTTEMFIRGGYNVHPAEVEQILGGHPAVDEIAVVPRPDPLMGEIGVAVVVPSGEGPPTLEALRAFGAGDLAAFKLPEALLAVDALPRNSADKLDRRRLAALVASAAQRPTAATGSSDRQQ